VHNNEDGDNEMKHAKAVVILTLVYCLVAYLMYDNPGERARQTMDADNLLGNNLYAITVGIQLIVKYLVLTGLYGGCLTAVAVDAIADKRSRNGTET
jgi:hypothetical protein